MQILPLGDAAALIQLEDRIDPGINQVILNLYEHLEAKSPAGYLYSIPAYSTLTVVFDPLETPYHDFSRQLQDLAVNVPNLSSPVRSLVVPVCYDPPFGLDLDSLSEKLGMDTKAIVEAHHSQTYRVFMIGFLPGFAYMGITPSTLHCARLETPRLKVPAGSVGLAGFQTGIYPLESPGGWQIIGRTPIPLFNPASPQPFMLRAGDQVRFEPVGIGEFADIENDCRNRNYKIQQYE